MLLRKVRSCLVEIVSWIKIWYLRLMGITIGKNCFIAFGAHIDVARGRITLGDNVDVASGSYILSHTGYQRLKEGQETKLEDGVRIFVNSIVLPGVKVGRNSWVGAGSVITKDVPPNTVMMGNPAKVVSWLESK